MKQIIQDLKTGQTLLEEVPVPQVKAGHLLIQTHKSLVSLGTERMLVEFGKANWLNKARQQPEKVKQVLQKIQSDGLKPTVEAVFRKLGEPLPLGYCNAGEVIAVGAGVSEFKVGDRVASNGHHAEIVCVPQNLAARIPESVSYEAASFTVIGAIALQGIRLVKPTFGETVVVTGLGLIGLIAAQLLKANGCRVIGLDFDEEKVNLARSWGVEAVALGKGTDPVKLVQGATNGIGADAVLITASTKSNEVISQSAQMSRKRGRIVLVGVIGLQIQRSDFYEKELTFQVSCSYGPGRYDDEYELKGKDYPLGFVRWTEKRNFEAVLQALAQGQLKVEPLITEVVPLAAYEQVYGEMGQSRSIASILAYDGKVSAQRHSVAIAPREFSGQKAVLGIIGAGNFTAAMIVPLLHQLGASMKYIASSKGLSGTTLAKKYGIAHSTTDYREILADEDVDAVLITTRHDAHAEQVIAALNAGKHVFVEKPLALTTAGLEDIEVAYNANPQASLTVGFNRRFSPFATEAKQLLGSQPGPMNVIATMNAGFIPMEHWVQDMKTGGGRIIGEACHLIDLISFFTGSEVEAVVMNAMGPYPQENTDNASILLRYANGSQGIIHYFANGNKAYAKERVEIYFQGKNIIIDNFRKSHYFGFKGKGLRKAQDKGHKAQFKQFVSSLEKGTPGIIPFESLMNTSRASLAAVASLKTGQWASVLP